MFFFLPSTNLDETNPFFVLFFITCIFGLFSLLLGSVTLLAFFCFVLFCFLFNELGAYANCGFLVWPGFHNMVSCN